MAISRRTPAPEEPDLSSQTDFQLLNALTGLVSKEQSQQLKNIAWEIMRRYSSCLDKPIPTIPKEYHSVLVNARWGDAKRVFEIFGMQRGPLTRLREAGLIKSNPPEKDSKNEGASPAAREKRLYDLISIVEYLESEKTNPTSKASRKH